MPTVTSLDNCERPLGNSERDMKCRDLAAKLQKFKTLVIQPISRLDLISVSEWLTYLNKCPWEVAVVQDCMTKQLRLVNGSGTNSNRIPAMVGSKHLRPNDMFIVHVHPVVRSRSSHVDADRKTAEDYLEGALDWSDILLCYDKRKLYNRPDRRSPVEGYLDARMAVFRGRIPFLDGHLITGYCHFDAQTKMPKYINPFSPLT